MNWSYTLYAIITIPDPPLPQSVGTPDKLPKPPPPDPLLADAKVVGKLTSPPTRRHPHNITLRPDPGAFRKQYGTFISAEMGRGL